MPEPGSSASPRSPPDWLELTPGGRSLLGSGILVIPSGLGGIAGNGLRERDCRLPRDSCCFRRYRMPPWLRRGKPLPGKDYRLPWRAWCSPPHRKLPWRRSRETASGKAFSSFAGGCLGAGSSAGGVDGDEESDRGGCGFGAGFFCGWGAGASGTDCPLSLWADPCACAEAPAANVSRAANEATIKSLIRIVAISSLDLRPGPYQRARATLRLGCPC